MDGTRLMLTLLGSATFLFPSGRKWLPVHVPRVVTEVALFHLLLLASTKGLGVTLRAPVSVWESLLLNPVQEELIFRQPLVFLRESKWYWPIGLLLGAVFVLLHQNDSLYVLVVRAAGTVLLLLSFRRYGLVGSILTHALLNLGVLIISRL